MRTACNVQHGICLWSKSLTVPVLVKALVLSSFGMWERPSWWLGTAVIKLGGKHVR